MSEKELKNLENEDSEELTEDGNQSVAKEIGAYLKIFIIAIVITLVLFMLIFVNAITTTGSMEPAVTEGSHVIGFRLAYLNSEPQRGDIVIFKYPVNEKLKYVKRIIGLPGETVDISDGKIYIDGSDTPLEEDYLVESWDTKKDGYHFEVPEGCYLVLGDNRNISLDSRFYANEALEAGVAENDTEADTYTYVTRKEIVAKAWFSFWPKFYLIKN